MAGEPRRRGHDSGFVRAMLPGMELGLVVAIFFIVLATQKPIPKEIGEPEAPDTARAEQSVDVAADKASRAGPDGEDPDEPVDPSQIPELRVVRAATGGPRFLLDGRDVALGALPAELSGSSPKVALRVDPGLTYADFHPLLVLLGEAGVTPLVPTLAAAVSRPGP